MGKNVFNPKVELFPQAKFKNMQEYQALVDEFANDYEGTWGRFAEEKIDWYKPFTKVLDESKAPFYKWFTDGKMNVANQCIDRHLATKADKTAIIFEPDQGKHQKITYKELSEKVNQTANLLKNECGVKKGDRVVLYMPMIPEAVYSILACARIGAIHSIVFGGFSSEALRDRVMDAHAKLVITADGAYRKGSPYMLKPIVDEALSFGCACVQNVLVVKRNNEHTDWFEDRDMCYNEKISAQSTECEPEIMDSEDPLFLLYTSGSTGKPKGVQHSSAGYILWAQMTMEWVFDIQEQDVYWCTADIGWITGHTYSVYGPLASGATTVIFEGVPTYPTAARCWSIVEEHKVTQFYTAPTAIRMLHKVGPNDAKQHDLTSLRILGTVGEPIDDKAWMWYYEEIGNSRCTIVDTWWQTETGGHMITPLPAATPIKPTSATFPLPGIIAEITDEEGNKKGANEKGLLCITKPWPSMIRTVWKNEDRFVSSYFDTAKQDGKPVYFSGDGAMYDEDGYIFITGRVDDVINVSGHRIGSAEVEAAIKHFVEVAEVAVVGQKHEIKGEAIFAYVVLKDSSYANEKGFKEINDTLAHEIGAIAKCDNICFVEGLPKTRSGKIMRRLLRIIARGEEITQDTSTLEDPQVVEKIKASQIFGS